MKANTKALKASLVIAAAACLIALPHPYFAGHGRTHRQSHGEGMNYIVSSDAPHPTPTPRQMRNSVGIEFVWIPPGSFMMGSRSGDGDEMPVHRVTIKRGFFMSKYEVTQAQWVSVMGYNRSNVKGDNLPAAGVSWDTAQAFVTRLSTKGDGYEYYLPTEAEWEYACRAGATGNHVGGLEELAWYYNNAGEAILGGEWNYERLKINKNRPRPVGEKRPNAFGLFDMYGNVWEWCQDVYHYDYRGAPKDGSARLKGGNVAQRVLRGGSWNDVASYLRPANRYWLHRNNGFYENGLRVVAVARR